MFCIHCGKTILEGASFCAFCGQPMQASIEPTVTEWEYTVYRDWWKYGEGGKYYLINGRTEYSVRLDLWASDESRIMKSIQKFIDLGWQPISSPGPNSYHFVHSTEYASSGNYEKLEVRTFVVEFRRPARQRTELEKRVIGVWQEAKDPNSGFLRRLGNIVISQRLEVERSKMEFRVDRTFNHTDRYGKKIDEGIFSERDGQITITYKYSPSRDATAIIKNGRLLVKFRDYNYEDEWERVG